MAQPARRKPETESRSEQSPRKRARKQPPDPPETGLVRTFVASWAHTTPGNQTKRPPDSMAAATSVHGLHNTGADCYASAVLQAVVNCPLSGTTHRTCPVSADPGDVHAAFVRLRQAYVEGKLGPGMSNKVLSAVRAHTTAVGSGPEDSQAFLTELLDRTCTKAKEAYTGTTESVLMCDACPHESRKVESFTSLMMGSLAEGIQQAYRVYADWEYLPDAICEKCKHPGMHKSISVKKTPPALVLVQKRPACMDLGKLKEAARTHRLWAAVCNTGGHYVALVRSPVSGAWHVANDGSVHPAGVDGEPPDSYRGVYMLFFAQK